MTHYSARITSRGQLETAFRAVSKLPYGYILTARTPTRSDKQNRMMWPILACFEQQAEINGRKLKDHQWKAVFLEALGHEQDMLPSLDGSRWFAAGLRSSRLTEAQFSALLELMLAEAAQRGVDLKGIGDDPA
jgi:hypothetical protein